MKRNPTFFHKKISLLGSILVLGPVCLLAGCGGQIRSYESADIAMGTVLNQTVYTAGEDETGHIRELVRTLEKEELSFREPDSQVGAVNTYLSREGIFLEDADSAGGGVRVEVSEGLFTELSALYEISRASGGAFDFTLGALTRLWNMDAQAAGEAEVHIPGEEEIARALQNCGWEKVTLEDGHMLFSEKVLLDLGAAGKGIACDRIGDYLRETEVTGAVISVGGSVVTWGEKPDGSPWQVGIVDPETGEGILGTLSLTGEWYISTSGDYERYVEVDGIRYHHILNPENGYPARSGIRSVTVVCHSGLVSDALSTACFVLGREEGEKLAARYGAETVFVDDEGNIYLSEGLEGIFKPKEQP